MSAPLREIGYANPRASGYWPALEQDPTPELRWPHSVRVYQRMRRQDALQDAADAVDMRDLLLAHEAFVEAEMDRVELDAGQAGAHSCMAAKLGAGD